VGVPGAAPCGGANGVEGGGRVSATWTAMDAAALGCSDSGERRTPHWCGGRGCDKGGWRGVSDAAAAG
jgi:hypothetical protein